VNRLSWQIKLGVGLIALTGVIDVIHVLVFHDARSVVYYQLMDVAFIPISVLFVTLILNQLLVGREKRLLMKKMNMVIGVFFGEVGTPMLRLFAQFCPDDAEIAPRLLVQVNWADADFSHADEWLGHHELTVRSQDGDLAELKAFLTARRDFMLRLLENPNLLEHEAFTELLWAVFHLTDELASRSDLTTLAATDYAHLSGDIKRAYALVMREWLGYMNHLRQDYPYLYSLAVRLDPFDPNASPEVQ
jgi:hypothetical protein